jgi:hypothetical protein
MPDEPEMPLERFYEALDLMVQAGWISKYARNANKTAIKWTDHGKQAIRAIYIAYEQLGPNKLNKDLWLSVAWIAKLRLVPGTPGFRDLPGISESN